MTALGSCTGDMLSSVNACDVGSCTIPAIMACSRIRGRQRLCVSRSEINEVGEAESRNARHVLRQSLWATNSNTSSVCEQLLGTVVTG